MMKNLVKFFLVFMVASTVLVTMAITLDSHYSNINIELLRIERNRLFQAGYEHGIRSTMHEFIEWIPAYKVVLPENANYSTFILEQKGKAVPVLFVDGTSVSSITNCIFTSTIGVTQADGIRMKYNLDGSGNHPETMNFYNARIGSKPLDEALKAESQLN